MGLCTLLILAIIPYITTYIGLYVFFNAWLALLAYHFVIIIVLIKRNQTLSNINYFIENKKILVSSLILILFILPLLLVTWDFIKIADLDLSYMLTKFHLDGFSFVVFIIYFFSINPILEELYWRIIITYNKNTKVDFLFDFLFAGFHILILILFVKITFVIVSFIALAIAGMTWRYIVRRYQDYVTIFVTHAVADLLIILAIYIINLG